MVMLTIVPGDPPIKIPTSTNSIDFLFESLDSAYQSLLKFAAMTVVALVSVAVGCLVCW